MANDLKNGPSTSDSADTGRFSDFSFSGSSFAPNGKRSTVDDSVVDEILRSISYQSSSPIPPAAAPDLDFSDPKPGSQPARPAQTTGQFTQRTQPVNQFTQRTQPVNQFTQRTQRTQPVNQFTQRTQPVNQFTQRTQPVNQFVHRTQPGVDPQDRNQYAPSSIERKLPPNYENSYSSAAHAAEQAAAAGDTTQFTAHSAAQTHSFQPARPTHRDTDRLPTLVEEKPIRRQTMLGKVLTFLVAILVLVALVLGVKIAYILGPSLGWNLPDPAQMPIISNIMQLLPQEEETLMPEELPETETPEDAAPAAVPTSVTLDAEELTLQPGTSVVLTAAVDVENWDGTIVWASGKEDVAIVTPLGPNTAQVDYVGEGRCVILAMASIAGSEESPSASCSIFCEAADGMTDEEMMNEDVIGDESEEAPAEELPAEHIDIVLNREDFTLKVGERHQLMTENADRVIWTSSDESVATVGETGIVTAVGAGTATITATGPDGTTASAIARIR